MEKDLLAEAREAFREIADIESEDRDLWEDDLRFRALDQWPDQLRRAREYDAATGQPSRPCLVIDQCDQYIRQVENDARQNPPGLKARPVDDDADPEVAEALTGLFRHIEDTSRATGAYITALSSAATIGRGFFRVGPALVDEDRNWQEPRITRISNPLSVYFDPYAVEVDGSDAQVAFVTERMKPSAFKRAFPDADKVDFQDDGRAYDDWYLREGIRVAEWWKCDYQTETLIELEDGLTITPDEYQQMLAMTIDGAQIGFKEIKRRKKIVVVRKISGAEVLEETKLPIQHIGIIPVIGNERWVDGRRVLYGMIRAAKDPQRARNYAYSAMVERIALEPKAPWVGPAAAIEGWAARWQRANTGNDSFLPYNHVDKSGQAVPAPTRQMADSTFGGWVQILGAADQAIQSAMGVYNASIGAPSNEKSGRAILARQHEGDVATFHYVDNLAQSISHAGRVILELIPVLYDQRRVQRILGEDGEASTVIIDPEFRQAKGETKDRAGVTRQIFNPTVGKYDITVSIGPSFSTKRQEAATAMSELISRQPGLMNLAGDIFARNLDWPGADELAERLKALLPPEVKQAEQESEVPPEVAQALQQVIGMVQQREQFIGEAMKLVEKAAQEMKDERSRLEVERAKAGAEKMISDADVEIEKARLDSDTKLRIARLNAATQRHAALAARLASLKVQRRESVQ